MQKSEAVKKFPAVARPPFVIKDFVTRLAERGWQGAQGPKSGSVASYMTPNHGKP